MHLPDLIISIFKSCESDRRGIQSVSLHKHLFVDNLSILVCNILPILNQRKIDSLSVDFVHAGLIF